MQITNVRYYWYGCVCVCVCVFGSRKMLRAYVHVVANTQVALMNIYIYIHYAFYKQLDTERRHTWRIRNLQLQSWLAFNEPLQCHACFVAHSSDRLFAVSCTACCHDACYHWLLVSFFAIQTFHQFIYRTHTFMPQPPPLLPLVVVFVALCSDCNNRSIVVLLLTSQNVLLLFC